MRNGYIEEPQDYDRNDFWGRITLDEATSSQSPIYAPSRAKLNSIRNLVLRYMSKALVCFQFSHKELGAFLLMYYSFYGASWPTGESIPDIT